LKSGLIQGGGRGLVHRDSSFALFPLFYAKMKKRPQMKKELTRAGYLGIITLAFSDD
jgi:hypothetical protein